MKSIPSRELAVSLTQNHSLPWKTDKDGVIIDAAEKPVQPISPSPEMMLWLHRWLFLNNKDVRKAFEADHKILIPNMPRPLFAGTPKELTRRGWIQLTTVMPRGPLEGCERDMESVPGTEWETVKMSNDGYAIWRKPHVLHVNPRDA